MALMNCPACNRLISEAAERCIHCGHPLARSEGAAAPTFAPAAQPSIAPAPLTQPPAHRGPPHDCRYCGGRVVKKADAEHGTTGCILLVLGIVLAPLIIGFFIILLALHVGTKRKAYWLCTRCEARFDRSIKWYEYG